MKLGTKAVLAAGTVGVMILAGLLGITVQSSTTVSSTLAAGTASVTASDAAGDSGGCEEADSGDGSTFTTSLTTSARENALKIAQAFADAGYSRASTAGVLGNIQAESGFNPTATSAGYGIAQWTPRSKIRAWFDANGLSDKDDSDLDGQVTMLIKTARSDFNNYYLSNAKTDSGITVVGNDLYETWRTATDPETAAVAWMAGWERPNWSLRHEDTRRQVASDFYSSGLSGITFKVSDGDGGTEDSGSTGDGSDESSSTETVSCSSGSGDSEIEVGKAPTGTHDYSWMCSWGGICKDGDYGPVGNISGDYQCVWYAWTRLLMIHGNIYDGAGSGDGGYIADTLSHKSGWVVTDEPKAGDGVSLRDGPGTVQHVAVVEKVEGTRIFISEGNARDSSAAGHWGEYNTRYINPSEYGYVKYFRHEGW